MAIVASSQPVNKPTYQSKMNGALERHTSLQQVFEDLTARINISLETLSALAGALQATPLRTFLDKQYENYDTIVKGHQIAMEALKQHREILSFCTPANVALDQTKISHLEGLGYDMDEYAKREVKLAESSVQLGNITTNLQQLTEKTKAYIDIFPNFLDTAARRDRQTTRDPTYGDKLPDTLGGAKGYFLKGLEEYHKRLTTESPTTAITTATPLSNEALLGTLSNIIAEQPEGKN